MDAGFGFEEVQMQWLLRWHELREFHRTITTSQVNCIGPFNRFVNCRKRPPRRLSTAFLTCVDLIHQSSTNLPLLLRTKDFDAHRFDQSALRISKIEAGEADFENLSECG